MLSSSDPYSLDNSSSFSYNQQKKALQESLQRMEKNNNLFPPDQFQQQQQQFVSIDQKSNQDIFIKQKQQQQQLNDQFDQLVEFWEKIKGKKEYQFKATQQKLQSHTKQIQKEIQDLQKCLKQKQLEPQFSGQFNTQIHQSKQVCDLKQQLNQSTRKLQSKLKERTQKALYQCIQISNEYSFGNKQFETDDLVIQAKAQNFKEEIKSLEQHIKLSQKNSISSTNTIINQIELQIEDIAQMMQLHRLESQQFSLWVTEKCNQLQTNLQETISKESEQFQEIVQQTVSLLSTINIYVYGSKINQQQQQQNSLQPLM